jgi:hypothetical protein
MNRSGASGDDDQADEDRKQHRQRPELSHTQGPFAATVALEPAGRRTRSSDLPKSQNPGTAISAPSQPDGTHTEIAAAGTLQTPGGPAVSRHGALYVTYRSPSPGIGEVLRITLH